MSTITDLFVGKSEKTSASGTQSGTAQRKPADKQAFSLLLRNLLGQQVAPPDTAISVPQQQAISQLQGMSPSSAGISARLNAPDPFAGKSFLPGEGQAGLQTREQLGLPSRASYNPLAISLDDLKSIGVPPVANPPRRTGRLGEKIERVERRAGNATAKGKPELAAKRTAIAERLKKRQ